jgi:orotate phosphoribosyltransferase
MVGEDIAKAGLEIGAIRLDADDPFLWASGYRMPIYNDNRMFLGGYQHRRMIAVSFDNILDEENIEYDKIAGTSTAGISPATSLVDSIGASLIYVRDKPKDHGLRNQIEGIGADEDLEGKKVVLIEDLISTGGSSARAVQAIRDANGECNYCLSIFNYGLDKAVEAFSNLDPMCSVKSLLYYDTLIKVAKETGYINDDQVKMLEEWRTDPFGWGEKHGFPKVER